MWNTETTINSKPDVIFMNDEPETAYHRVVMDEVYHISFFPKNRIKIFYKLNKTEDIFDFTSKDLYDKAFELLTK